jgi:hypothetical protein
MPKHGNHHFPNPSFNSKPSSSHQGQNFHKNPSQNWNNYPNQNFKGRNYDKKPHFGKHHQDMKHSRNNNFDQMKRYDRQGGNYMHQHKGTNPKYFNNRDRRGDHRRSDNPEQVFNMGGIKGEIIGSDRQRISLNKGGPTNLSNRVSLGRDY